MEAPALTACWFLWLHICVCKCALREVSSIAVATEGLVVG